MSRWQPFFTPSSHIRTGCSRLCESRTNVKRALDPSLGGARNDFLKIRGKEYLEITDRHTGHLSLNIIIVVVVVVVVVALVVVVHNPYDLCCYSEPGHPNKQTMQV